MLNQKRMFSVLGIAAIALTLSACGKAQTNSAGTANAPAEVVANTVTMVSKGNFSGRSDHITTGKVTLEKTASGYQLSFADDFELDGAPDPIVAIGNGEKYLPANKLGALKNRTGRQTYQLPASFKPGQFSQVYVWCEKFSVPLGIADLT